MAEGGINRKLWRIDKSKLDDYMETIKLLACEETDEVKYLFHCTSLSNKGLITESRRLMGTCTDLPKKAPLAFCEEMKGVWLTAASLFPEKSPYGTQRLSFPAVDIVNFMKMQDDQPSEQCDLAEDSQEEEEQIEAKFPKTKCRTPDPVDDGCETTVEEMHTCKKAKLKKLKKTEVEEIKKLEQSQKYSKEYYIKTNQPSAPEPNLPLPVLTCTLPEPLLFFECAHYYGKSQHIRLLLVRSEHPMLQWCRDNCKELDLRSNPLFCFRQGRIYRSKSRGNWKDMVTEVLVVGDIQLDKLQSNISWSTVGKGRRAGFDPRLGILYHA